jgi:DNA-binding NtrC family response regulator
MKLKILIVDDEPDIVEMLKRYLSLAGDSDILTAGTAEEAAEICRKENPSILLTDIGLPGDSGIELLKKIKEHNPSVQVVIMTGQSSLDRALDCLERGASDYLMKPLDMGMVEKIVKESMERYARWYEVVKHNLKKGRKAA